MSSQLESAVDSPMFWVLAGAGTASWWLRNPSSKLFWFVAGASAATFWIQDPAMRQVRARIYAAKERRRCRHAQRAAAAGGLGHGNVPPPPAVVSVPEERPPVQAVAAVIPEPKPPAPETHPDVQAELWKAVDALRTELVELRSQRLSLGGSDAHEHEHEHDIKDKDSKEGSEESYAFE